jgi:hypothetical protein
LVPFPRSVYQCNPVSELYGQFLRPNVLVFALTCTVNQDFLLDRLERWVGLSSPVLNWSRTYLTSQEFFLSPLVNITQRKYISCGVPQGSILGQVLFSLYTVDVGSLHTLRLESLNLVFQLLHKCPVKKLLFWQVG